MIEENTPMENQPKETSAPAEAVVTPPMEAEPPKKKESTIPLSAAVASVVTAVVIAVLLTFAITTNYLKRDPAPPPAESDVEADVFDQMALLDKIFREMGVVEREEDFGDTLLKMYVDATGDVHAEYFTDEEYAALTDTRNGVMCGIGISVTSSAFSVDGTDRGSILVTEVNPDSPAEEAGVLPGDHILSIELDGKWVSVEELGYAEASARMVGEEGTVCTFIVYRSTSENTYETVEISATRRKLTTYSVKGRVHSSDPTVGVVRITKFNATTATQFVETMEALKAEGCTSFVLDLRDNTGGLLTSVEDLLTFFLQEGDTVISTKDKNGNTAVTKLTVNEEGVVLVGTRKLTKEDIGRYRDLPFVVLVNGYTASAAELFTANMRDYELATIVGEKTYGKGSMQTSISLAKYGYSGVLKLTYAYYYPASGEGYHGEGLHPDISVERAEAYKHINLSLLTDEQDDQLAKAIEALPE